MTARLQAWALRVAGLLVLTIGVGHIFMPSYGYEESATRGMSAAARDHFFSLGTYAICSFLLAFGILALFHSKQPGTRAARVYATVMTAVWSTRIALEVRYPIDVPIFAIVRPHLVVLPVLTVISAAFLLAAVPIDRLRSAPRAPGA